MRNSDQLKSSDTLKQCEGCTCPIKSTLKCLGREQSMCEWHNCHSWVEESVFFSYFFPFLQSASLYCSLYLFMAEDFLEFLFRVGEGKGHLGEIRDHYEEWSLPRLPVLWDQSGEEGLNNEYVRTGERQGKNTWKWWRAGQDWIKCYPNSSNKVSISGEQVRLKSCLSEKSSMRYGFLALSWSKPWTKNVLVMVYYLSPVEQLQSIEMSCL